MDHSVYQYPPIPEIRLTKRVRQACNHTSVVSNSVRQDRWVEGANIVTIHQVSPVQSEAARELYLLEGDGNDEGGWQERGLCAQTDPEAFFPEKGGSTREAKKVCLTCDVRQECLEYALAHDERFGIWGGLSERERRKLKKRAV
jgi:WhiB family redox-sensing transcriptional regulator